ncbi:Chromosome partition protein Smc [Carpediemonas membranifera]|uniref:Chromosome partition protein Smc n=1 Tax=Carpediemonas membranifera TaxID=201153 RepID=A0A8J6EA25_9EUKA|nr:Chromosome partition protein Smc [Carpediemonas membranifera]|eukprot:KAG9394135.1 Chromosome partition protein Smc [Carpediemonas membranifera]
MNAGNVAYLPGEYVLVSFENSPYSFWPGKIVDSVPPNTGIAEAIRDPANGVLGMVPLDSNGKKCFSYAVELCNNIPEDLPNGINIVDASRLSPFAQLSRFNFRDESLPDDVRKFCRDNLPIICEEAARESFFPAVPITAGSIAISQTKQGNAMHYSFQALVTLEEGVDAPLSETNVPWPEGGKSQRAMLKASTISIDDMIVVRLRLSSAHPVCLIGTVTDLIGVSVDEATSFSLAYNIMLRLCFPGQAGDTIVDTDLFVEIPASDVELVADIRPFIPRSKSTLAADVLGYGPLLVPTRGAQLAEPIPPPIRVDLAQHPNQGGIPPMAEVGHPVDGTERGSYTSGGPPTQSYAEHVNKVRATPLFTAVHQWLQHFEETGTREFDSWSSGMMQPTFDTSCTTCGTGIPPTNVEFPPSLTRYFRAIGSIPNVGSHLLSEKTDAAVAKRIVLCINALYHRAHADVVFCTSCLQPHHANCTSHPAHQAAHCINYRCPECLNVAARIATTHTQVFKTCANMHITPVEVESTPGGRRRFAVDRLMHQALFTELLWAADFRVEPDPTHMAQGNSVLLRMVATHSPELTMEPGEVNIRALPLDRLAPEHTKGLELYFMDEPAGQRPQPRTFLSGDNSEIDEAPRHSRVVAELGQMHGVGHMTTTAMAHQVADPWPTLRADLRHVLGGAFDLPSEMRHATMPSSVDDVIAALRRVVKTRADVERIADTLSHVTTLDGQNIGIRAALELPMKRSNVEEEDVDMGMAAPEPVEPLEPGKDADALRDHDVVDAIVEQRNAPFGVTTDVDSQQRGKLEETITDAARKGQPVEGRSMVIAQWAALTRKIDATETLLTKLREIRDMLPAGSPSTSMGEFPQSTAVKFVTVRSRYEDALARQDKAIEQAVSVAKKHDSLVSAREKTAAAIEELQARLTQLDKLVADSSAEKGRAESTVNGLRARIEGLKSELRDDVGVAPLDDIVAKGDAALTALETTDYKTAVVNIVTSGSKASSERSLLDNDMAQLMQRAGTLKSQLGELVAKMAATTSSWQ